MQAAISVHHTFGESFSMKRLFFVFAVALMATVTFQPALATKEFGEHFKKFYADDSKNATMEMRPLSTT